MKKNRRKKIKELNRNQRSFYFEDFVETNLRQKKSSKSFVSEDRIYILFFCFHLFDINFLNKDYFYFFSKTKFYTKSR